MISRLLFFILIFNLLFFPVGKPAPAMPLCPNHYSCLLDCEERPLTLQRPYLQGEDVLDLQQGLKIAGYYHNRPDGIFGPATAKAVKSFQVNHHLKPDGVVTSKTWATLSLVFTGRNAAQPVQGDKIPPGEVSILIDTVNRTLTVFVGNKPFKQYPVAVGKPETPTPVGNWHIVRKAKDWGDGFGSRWLGLSVPWGIYGIHGTNKPWSIGDYASHGCVRMENRNVEEVYNWVKPGTRVTIIGNPFGLDGEHRTLRRDDRGSDVLTVQRRLHRYGYYHGEMDGIYGWDLEKAVTHFRKKNGLPTEDSLVDGDMYKALGL